MLNPKCHITMIKTLFNLPLILSLTYLSTICYMLLVPEPLNLKPGFQISAHPATLLICTKIIASDPFWNRKKRYILSFLQIFFIFYNQTHSSVTLAKYFFSQDSCEIGTGSSNIFVCLNCTWRKNCMCLKWGNIEITNVVFGLQPQYRGTCMSPTAAPESYVCLQIFRNIATAYYIPTRW